MKSITGEQFQQLLRRHLNGMAFFEGVVLKIPFDTTPDGIVYPSIIDNVRIIFILAVSALAGEAPESATFHKMKCVLEDLMPYGTEVCSSKTKQFLTTLQKNPQQIIEKVTYSIPKEILVGDEPLPEPVAEHMISYLTYIMNDSLLDFVDDVSLN